MDFAGVEPTRSFVDEFIGRLAEALGEECFLNRVRLVNLTESARMLPHNIAHAAAQYSDQASPWWQRSDADY